jgi:hypothetical protein
MVLVGTLVQEEGLSRVKPSMGSVYLSSSNSPAKMAFVMFGRSPEDENTARIERPSFLLLKQCDTSASL